MMEVVISQALLMISNYSFVVINIETRSFSTGLNFSVYADAKIKYFVKNC